MSGMRATSPLKADLARQMRTTAGAVDKSHPEMVAGQHLRKAATLVSSGQHDGAKRHLDAAMELMTPRNLIRHGITDDEGHATAKQAMHQINVHRLGVQDVQDVEARNEQQAGAKKDSLAEQAQARAAKLQAAAAAKQQAAGQKTAAKPTGTGPGSQQQSGPVPDPILATANPAAGGILLSAQTAALERTPHPNGRPGGPGLYGKAGNKHSDYFEQIVHALMTKRGMSQAQASAIAWSRLRKWSAGGGKVHPEVRAAAAAALGKEAAAKLAADPWEQAGRLIELACGPVELAGFNPAQPRVAAGSAGGGQFGGGSGGGGGSRAQRRAKLVKRAVTLRGEIAQLVLQIHAATHKTHKSKSSAPRKKGAAAISAKQVAAAKAKAPAKASTKAAAHKMTLAQMRTRLAALRTELHATMVAIHHLANEEREAIELSYKDAWRHELRGPGGQFVSGGGGPRTQQAVRHRAVKNAMIRRGGPSTAHVARSRTAAGVMAAAKGTAAAPPGQLHPEVEHRVRQIAKELDTGVQQTAAKDAAAKAAGAAKQARQALTDFQAKADAESKHGARIKFATEAGVAVAGAVVTWIESRTGAPDLALILSGPAVLFVQLIIEWIKRL